MKPRNPKKSKKLNRGSSSSSSAPSPPWTELPEHLTADILQRLYTEEIIDCAQYVCKTWWRVCQNPATWRSIDLDYRRPAARDFGNICLCGGCVDYEICCREGGCTHRDICRCWANKFEYLVRRAVDLSQGQLLNLKLGVWDLYDMLDYVANRSRQLQCLTIFVCDYDESNIDDLILAIKKLPQLEELHLMMNPKLMPNDFETIGIACPMLKLFSYHNCLSTRTNFSGDVEAIGKTMPKLRHLLLCEHHMGYKGLEAILDGCPHLKSLDLRLCSGFDKVNKHAERHSYSDYGLRPSMQRKYLWLHTDPISFMDWIMERKDNYDIDSEYIHSYSICDDVRGDYY